MPPNAWKWRSGIQTAGGAEFQQAQFYLPIHSDVRRGR
jgi:hypothetical protein